MMARFLVDSNVLLDILTEDSQWFSWSAETLSSLSDTDRLCINPVIYGEVSIRFSSIEQLEEALTPDFFERLDIPYEAAFLAGKCFTQYRKREGRRLATLPDFFIGAHAAVSGMKLITRDSACYRTYFPKLQIISPK